MLQNKFGDDIVKCLTPDVVECMLMAKYDAESRELSSPINAYISLVEVGNADFNLGSKKEKEEKKTKEGKKGRRSTQP